MSTKPSKYATRGTNDDSVSLSESKSESKSSDADEFSEKNLNSSSSSVTRSVSGAGFDDRDFLLSNPDHELEDNAGVVARSFLLINAINDTVKRAALAHHEEKHNLGELVQEKMSNSSSSSVQQQQQQRSDNQTFIKNAKHENAKFAEHRKKLVARQKVNDARLKDQKAQLKAKNAQYPD